MIENPQKLILSDAKEIASEQGVNKINIRLVAQRCNISIGTVYNYYATKTDLLIAVVEDFWTEAFDNINYKKKSKVDFYEQIYEMYHMLYSYFRKFKTNWLTQMSLLSIEGRKHGRVKEKRYFDKIHSYIISLMDNDDSIGKKVWPDDSDRRKIAGFIFDSMLAMLKREEYEIDYFILILKKIMSE